MTDLNDEFGIDMEKEVFEKIDSPWAFAIVGDKYVEDIPLGYIIQVPLKELGVKDEFDKFFKDSELSYSSKSIGGVEYSALDLPDGTL